ncbi:hypothetical protein RB594_007015 [Gaeumannomyces avenae]
MRYWRCLLAAAAAVAGALECRPHGPILPRPNLAKSQSFQKAARELQEALDAATGVKIRAGWEVPNTTISLAFVSKDQPVPGIPLWEYHHLASNTFLGTRKVDRNSQYQIGSISKAITDAVLIRSGINLDDPITQYIPGLSGPAQIPWETITLRGLASHLAGIPPNYGGSESFLLKGFYESLGLPHIMPADYLMCDVIGLNYGCSRPQYVVGLRAARPVAPPMSRPVYSNVAFTLLSYALGLMRGQEYPALLYEYITGPLQMTNTYPSPGLSYWNSTIPPVGNSWGAYFGDATPGGGLVSSLSDLSSFLHAILTYRIFDNPADVREWLQPRSFTGSPHSFFGMPWEIYRPPPQALFSKTYDAKTGHGGHTVTIATKDGAAYGYRARMSVIDEYGVGVVLLAAGDSGSAVTAISDAMLSVLIPAVDAAAREQAVELGYTGTFQNSCGGGPSLSATLALDGTSLVLQSLSRAGKDMVAALLEMFGLTYGMLVPNYRPGSLLRLYPAEVSTRETLGGRRVVKEDWRFVWDVTRQSSSELPGAGVGAYDCLAWEAVDWIYYGSESVDRIVFVKDAESGEVLGLEVPFLRASAFKGEGWCGS